MARNPYAQQHMRRNRGLFRAVAALFILPLAACEDDDGLIIVNNQTARPITSVVINPCGATTAGTNRISGSIPDGGQRSFRVSFGCYDVSVVTEDNLTGEWDVDVSRRDRRVELFADQPGVS
jgi:hypothetical protein